MSVYPQEILDRYWSKVHIRTADDCWEWTAAKTAGYGVLNVYGTNFLAHRLSWLIARGPIAEGLFVRHRCDNRACVNPGHLELGEAADNTADAISRGRFRYHPENLVGAQRPRGEGRKAWRRLHARTTPGAAYLDAGVIDALAIARRALDRQKAQKRQQEEAEHFWRNVQTSDLLGCWLWTGRVNRRYGAFFAGGRDWLAHRYAYTDARGPIPDGLLVMHDCDTPLCVNPAHLRLGTAADNSADCVAKGRQARGDSHSSRTHPERVPRGERAGRAKLTEAQVKELAEKQARGALLKNLAKEYGVSITVVSNIVRGRLWRHSANERPTRLNGRLGHANHRSRLTEDQVRSIREHVANGTGVRALAEEYGVAVSSVRSIVQGKTWRHLDP